MKNLPQAKVCPFRDPGFGRLAHDHPKSCASGMAISWNTMVAFEPPLVACVVSRPKYSLATLRAPEDRRVAILALKRRTRV